MKTSLIAGKPKSFNEDMVISSQVIENNYLFSIKGSTTIERVAMEKDHSENRVEYTQASGNGRVPIFGNRM